MLSQDANIHLSYTSVSTGQGVGSSQPLQLSSLVAHMRIPSQEGKKAHAFVSLQGGTDHSSEPLRQGICVSSL